MHDIENMSDGEFKAIDPKELQKLSPEKQFNALKDGRIGNLSNEQLKVLNPDTISIFIQSSKDNMLMDEKLTKFIQTINFKYVQLQIIIMIFDYKNEIISKEQIHQIDLTEVKQSDFSFYQKIIIQKYFNFSFDQFYFLTQNNNLKNIDESKLPKEFIDIIEIIKNIKTFTRFNRYCSNPDRYELPKDVLNEMPSMLKIIYLVNYTDKIRDDLRKDFQSSIIYIFKNPSLFCSNVLLFLIKEWPKEIISQCIEFIDINTFPKTFLIDLLQEYDLPQEKKNQFEINSIQEIKNKDVHFFIFKFFVNKKNIQDINIDHINMKEKEFLVQNWCEQLSDEQISKMDLNFSSRDNILHFLKNHYKKIQPPQVAQLDMEDPEIARIIISSDNINNISKNQIPKIKIQEIGKNANKKLIEFLFQNQNYEFMDHKQVKHVNINMIDDVTLQIKFCIYFSISISEDQISAINFEKVNDKKIIGSLINKLDIASKLHYLSRSQIEQLNIFNYENYLDIFFINHSFAKYLTNDQVTEIYPKSKSFGTIDFGNVEKNFLNYAIANDFKLKENQIKQINLEMLVQDIYINFINDNFDILDTKQIQQIDFNIIPDTLLKRIIENRCKDIISKQLECIKIQNLDDSTQLKILKEKIDFLSPVQIVKFNTKNVQIANILITNKIDYLNQEQINSIDVSDIDISKQAIFLNSNNKFFEKLDQNFIKKIKLNDIKKYDYGIYYDLIMIKTDSLSIDQFMSIDWLDDSKDEHHKREFSMPARIFLQSFENINDNIEPLFLEKNLKILDKKYISDIPEEILVAILNPRIINNLFDSVPSNINIILPAIKRMFISTNVFLNSVEYILQHWTSSFGKLIANYICHLQPAEYSNETISILLKYYIIELKPFLIKSFNITNIQNDIMEKALLFRATDFDPKQIEQSKYHDPLLISQTIYNINHKLSMVDLSKIPIVVV
ncbi:hypothetical protein M9Y10_042821 [Tritrichomonas musculus]|uniref:HECT domain-containing protein n=1 Tax=Tritrichomonas musculus TaxID=1915356 RepID=A0ABR2JYJ5_9EUKA